MKKLLVLLSTFACALCLVFGIAGCSTNKDVQGTYYLFVSDHRIESDYYILEKDTWKDSSGAGGRYEVKDGNITLYTDFFGEEVAWMTGTVGNGKLILPGWDGPLEYYKEGYEHIHKFIVVNSKTATCTVQGQIIKVCSGCGERIKETIPIDKNAHCMSGSDPKCTECGITLATELRFSESEYSDHATLTHGNSSINGEIIIPAFYNNKPVTLISSWAFSGCKSQSITIPNSVTSIGEYAFYECTSLESVIIGNGVTSIGSGAFGGTAFYYDPNNWTNDVLYIGDYLITAENTLSESYEIRQGTKLIADEAFYKCESLESITIPDSVTSIGKYAFSGCTAEIKWGDNPYIKEIGNYAFYGYKGTSITIPDSVTSIGEGAFYECTSFTSITIPDSVTSIDSSAFEGCTSLESIMVSDNNTAYASQDRILYNKDKTELIRVPQTKTSITIPNSVSSIGELAFSDCTSLTNITIPDGVTSIGYGAFYGCTAEIKWGDNPSIKEIGDYAFREYKGTSITIPNSVTSIGSSVFYYCTNLTSVTIGNGVTYIGYNAFYGCTNLESVTFKNTNGWYYVSNSSDTRGWDIPSSSLQKTETAATYLKETYTDYYWKRKTT